MDPLRGEGDDEGSSLPLVGSAVAPSWSREKKRHKRDLHVLSVAFLLVFSAYGAAQNLQSTVNTVEDLGTTSMGILYLSFTVFSIVGSPMVRVLGSKAALVLGTSGYWLFIASNLKPSWYTMVPASLYLGYAASIIWIGQGTYLTSAARSHAKDCNFHEGTVIGSFNGEFWGMFASTQVIGNLVSLALLRGGKEGESFTGTTLLFSVFLGSMTAGTILMCFLSNRGDKMESNQGPSNFHSYMWSLLRSAISPLLDKRMLLTIPLLIYSGLQQAFVWADFTKYVVAPSLGVSGVGGAMAVFGLFDAICSVVAGKYTSGLNSITLTLSGGAFIQTTALLCLLVNSSFTSEIVALLFPLLIAALWGIGDGIFNTQLNALLGILFVDNTEAAFAQLRVWQSASTAVIFFVSPCITLQILSQTGLQPRAIHRLSVWLGGCTAGFWISIHGLSGCPLIAYTIAWTTLLIAIVAVVTFFPEAAFTWAFSPSSRFSTSCGGTYIRVPGDLAWEVVCLPARLFGWSNMDLLVPPVFAVLVVGCSAAFIRAIGLWETDEGDEAPSEGTHF